MSAVTLRPERPGDEPSIHALTEAAFLGTAFSDGSEPDLIGQLRSDGDLALSLVAERADHGLVGHIAFSRVTISNNSADWYGLGPVSVLPEFQRSGIGTALINQGIAELRQAGACGIVLLGDPGYYARFGFEHDPQLSYPGPPAEYFQRLVLDGPPPSGVVRYADAFSAA
ncbi:GNAT family N-acetyltransferase [Pontixanthobacter luteolus]|uniref:GNAT family N-acetyltransferase n=1 Tax=Pontixanthobacter luteolus TaxID=295089 RepID=UPI0023027BBF|nr:N-acetyltransferase [Pontixanthobacter luteolus]